MECERELLIEASCPGVKALQETPCAGTWLQWTYAKEPYLPWGGQMPFWHPGLRKRMTTIMECSYFSVFRLWMLDAYKNNKCYYFVEVTGFAVLDEEISKIYGRPVWIIDSRRPPMCFFLGSYPLYWVWEWKGFGYAHDTFWGNRWAIGLEPFIPLVDMGIFRDMAEDRWTIYLKPEVIEQYKEQKNKLQARKTWQILCLAKNYPKEVTKPKRIVKTYRGPGTPDIPWSEIKLPTLDKPAAPPPKPPEMQLHFYEIDQNTIGCEIHYPK